MEDDGGGGALFNIRAEQRKPPWSRDRSWTWSWRGFIVLMINPRVIEHYDYSVCVCVCQTKACPRSSLSRLISGRCQRSVVASLTRSQIPKVNKILVCTSSRRQWFHSSLCTYHLCPSFPEPSCCAAHNWPCVTWTGERAKERRSWEMTFRSQSLKSNRCYIIYHIYLYIRPLRV